MTGTRIGSFATALAALGILLFGTGGRSAFGTDRGYAVAFGGSGAVYIAGATSGGLDRPATEGVVDAFVAKFDMAGSLQWSRQAGSQYFGTSGGVAVDGLENVYIVGRAAGNLEGAPGLGDDTFLSKYDAAGTRQWTRRLGPGFDDSVIAAEGLENVYISGMTTESLDGPFAGGYFDAWVSKYDAAGNIQWTRQLGSPFDDRSNSVGVDGLGNAYISGVTSGSLDGPFAGGVFDAFVSKYDATGNLEWTRQLGTANYDWSESVSADGLGNVYISGFTNGPLGGPRRGVYDAFLAKYDAGGNLQWTRQLSTGIDTLSNGVAADRLGNVFISGQTIRLAPGTGETQWDVFVAKYSAAGDLQWNRLLGTGTDGFDLGYGVSTDGLGNAYITGVLAENSAFVAKYDAAGNSEWIGLVRDNIPEPPNKLMAALVGLTFLSLRRRRR
jgi:hypothetical protein